MVYQLVLSRWLVRALKAMGHAVCASCVREFRPREKVRAFGVNGAFRDLDI